MGLRLINKLLSVCTLLLSSACTNNIQQISATDLTDLSEVKGYVLFENEPLTVNRNETITVDLAQPIDKPNSAIVLVMHGNHSKKEAHRNHIIELAKHGFTAIALQFKNSGQWYQNGRLLARVIPKLKAGIKLSSKRIKSSDIILVGHSFGGYASAIAAGTYQHVKGVILLDPAMFDKRGPEFLAKISAPTIIVGADKKVFRSRKRDLFFQKINDKKIEFSVTGATHDDAQNPSMFAISSYGIDPYTSSKNQELITKLIVDGAVALTQKNGMTAFREKITILEKQSKITSVKNDVLPLFKQN
jgi:dienelactone hydrolase